MVVRCFIQCLVARQWFSPAHWKIDVDQSGCRISSPLTQLRANATAVEAGAAMCSASTVDRAVFRRATSRRIDLISGTNSCECANSTTNLCCSPTTCRLSRMFPGSSPTTNSVAKNPRSCFYTAKSLLQQQQEARKPHSREFRKRTGADTLHRAVQFQEQQAAPKDRLGPSSSARSAQRFSILIAAGFRFALWNARWKLWRTIPP